MTRSLPADVAAVTDGRTLWMDSRRGQAEKRCTVLHELLHIERGDHGCQDPATERSIEQQTARLLIPIGMLLDALAWSDHPTELADILWVDEATLRARIDGLTAREREQVDEVVWRAGRAP